MINARARRSYAKKRAKEGHTVVPRRGMQSEEKLEQQRRIYAKEALRTNGSYNPRLSLVERGNRISRDELHARIRKLFRMQKGKNGK